MKTIRLSLLGFGTVGQGLVELLMNKRALLEQSYGLEVRLVGVANGRHGLIYREEGLEPERLLKLAAAREPLTNYPDVQHWRSPLEGLQATGGDVLAEASGTNLRDAEPGMSHIRTALERRMHVITANKGPGALAGTALLALAREQGVLLRMESTVMAGTPVLSTIREGLAGTEIRALRGILNGTTNYILSAMATGRAYAEVLAEAQALGYAESDPSADVEGYDAVAKVLILAALVFGQQLRPEQVARRGISDLNLAEIQTAQEQGQRIKLIAELRRSGATGLSASVAPVALGLDDPLARVDGVLNALTIEADTLSAVTITGPGAGRLQTGQGLLSDLIAVAQATRA